MRAGADLHLAGEVAEPPVGVPFQPPRLGGGQVGGRVRQRAVPRNVRRQARLGELHARARLGPGLQDGPLVAGGAQIEQRQAGRRRGDRQQGHAGQERGRECHAPAPEIRPVHGVPSVTATGPR